MKVEHELHGDRKVYTVSAFNRGVASWLTRLPTIWVEGEVTEFRRQDRWQSVFFTLKDPNDGDIIDFYGPCDYDPLGKEEIARQRAQLQRDRYNEMER